MVLESQDPEGLVWSGAEATGGVVRGFAFEVMIAVPVYT